MLRPLVVLWLATDVPPDAETALAARLALLDARAVPPASVAPAASDGQAVAHEIEELLEAARAATPETDATFRRVDELLRAHPELPQAAWLMAERRALEAQLLMNQGTPEAAAAAAAMWLDARRLEGRRELALGLPSAAVEGSPAALPQANSEVRAPRRDDSVFVDGRRRTHAARTTAGLHHVRHFRAGKSLSSRWLDLRADAVLELGEPAKACDELDLAGVVAAASGPAVPAGVLCERWAAARIDAAGSAELSFCSRESCGTWTSLRAVAAGAGAAPGELDPNPDADGSSRGTAWLTWGALGLAALATTGVILWQTGAFEREPPSTQFIFTGPSAAAVRF